MAQEATNPTQAEEIVDLIRRQDGYGGYSIDRDAAVALIEMYASIVAGEASIKAIRSSYAKCLAITDEVLLTKLCRSASPHPDTAVSP